MSPNANQSSPPLAPSQAPVSSSFATFAAAATSFFCFCLCYSFFFCYFFFSSVCVFVYTYCMCVHVFITLCHMFDPTHTHTHTCARAPPPTPPTTTTTTNKQKQVNMDSMALNLVGIAGTASTGATMAMSGSVRVISEYHIIKGEGEGERKNELRTSFVRLFLLSQRCSIKMFCFLYPAVAVHPRLSIFLSLSSLQYAR
jgi:hypothetical protein